MDRVYLIRVHLLPLLHEHVNREYVSVLLGRVRYNGHEHEILPWKFSKIPVIQGK